MVCIYVHDVWKVLVSSQRERRKILNLLEDQWSRRLREELLIILETNDCRDLEKNSNSFKDIKDTYGDSIKTYLETQRSIMEIFMETRLEIWRSRS